jgi:hypothetical protein
MSLQLYFDENTNITLESEADHYTIRFYDKGERIGSVQVVGVSVDTCHIKDLSMSDGLKLTPSIGKLLVRYLKDECGYVKIIFERRRNDSVNVL